jgi:hypothetical protein
MVARKLFAFFVVAVFSCGLANSGLAAEIPEQGLVKGETGTVTKIESGQVIIRDTMGSEKSIVPENPEALTTLKVGDQVSVKEGILTKVEVGGNEPSPHSPGPKN